MTRRRENSGAGQPRRLGKGDTDTWIEVSGFVSRLLHDDDDGSQHQRFIIDIGSGQTLLIAHNLDLSERVPVSLGDRVLVRGMYEWNDLGGLLHWTHDDPLGKETGGWVRHRARLFR